MWKLSSILAVAAASGIMLTGLQSQTEEQAGSAASVDYPAGYRN